MSKRAEELLRAINEAGCNSDDIKKNILDKFKSYFKNFKNLEKYVFDSEILSAYSYFIAYSHDSDFFDGIKQVLEIYNLAYAAYPNELLSMMVSILEYTVQKENQMFTVTRNLPNLKNDDFYDKAISIFKLIGDSLEISVKYIVIELYAVLKLLKRGIVDYDQIKKYKFGVAIQGILDQQKLSNILQLKPHNLKLSDWRNIAYHHIYSINPNEIKCEYGKNKSKITLTMPDLEKYIHCIIKSSNILNIARCIFAFDNLSELQNFKGNQKKDDIVFRKNLLTDRLKISLLSQGFNVLSYTESEMTVILSLCDLKNNGDLDVTQEKTRIIHASQFLFHLWQTSKKENLKIIYYRSKQTLVAEILIKSEIFEKLIAKKESLSNSAKYVNFIFH